MGIDIKLKTNIGETCLHIAAQYGHLGLCKILLDTYNFDKHLATNEGWTAIHFSAKSGNYELFTHLHDRGADINFKTNLGENCIHIAAQYGHLGLCKTLLDTYNFDKHLPTKNGWTALHFSAKSGSYELFTYLHGMGAEINLKTNLGENYLHIAAKHRHLSLCKTLIDKHNFDVNMADNNGWTALHFSGLNGSYELIKYFHSICTDIKLKTNRGRNILHIAAGEYKYLNFCKTLIDKYNFDVHIPDNDGFTALHFSARTGSYESVSYFHGLGTDINLKTNDGRNCLHVAARCGNFDLCKTFVDKHKFDIHLPDKNGWTALHNSIRRGSYKLFMYFYGMGADIYLKTKKGFNCLHIAASIGDLDLCKTLIYNHNFDINLKSNDGWTTLHFSAEAGSYESITFFVGMGSDIYLKTNNGTNCLHIAASSGRVNLCKTLIDKHKFDVNIANKTGWTALHYSANNGSYELFLYFLEKGSEIYRKTRSMKNVLHIASSKGHFDICKFLLEYFTRDYDDNNTKKNQYTLNGNFYKSQVFYKYSAIFLHAMDNDGSTYLHLVAHGNQATVCDLLLNYDTEIITLLNHDGETAKVIAEDLGHTDVIDTLKTEFDRSCMFSRCF